MAQSNTTHTARVDAPGLGIACLVGGSFFVLINDVAIKWSTDAIPVGEIIFFRSGFAVLILLTYVAIRGSWHHLRVINVRGQALRAVLMAVATLIYFSAIGEMPLADITTMTFISVLVVTALSPWALGEHVGWRRWIAILVGFAGVVVMLRPGPTGLYWIALLPLLASTMGALRDLITRRINLTETSISMLFYTMLMETLLGAATAPFVPWVSIPWADLAPLIAAGALFALAQFLHIEAFRYAEASVVSPFRYSSLVWAVLFGYLIWGDLPDIWTITGGSIIIISGLYILHRETRLARQRRR
tara:strand:+ start:350 stop:1255 length:906 start_codon:yes stop_codon:yes gene_type:complete